MDLIRARMFGNRIYVDVEIRAKGDDTLLSTHELAHRVHDVIEKIMKMLNIVWFM